jgi:hypothetical protein
LSTFDKSAPELIASFAASPLAINDLRHPPDFLRRGKTSLNQSLARSQQLAQNVSTLSNSTVQHVAILRAGIVFLCVFCNAGWRRKCTTRTSADQPVSVMRDSGSSSKGAGANEQRD